MAKDTKPNNRQKGNITESWVERLPPTLGYALLSAIVVIVAIICMPKEDIKPVVIRLISFFDSWQLLFEGSLILIIISGLISCRETKKNRDMLVEMNTKLIENGNYSKQKRKS